MLHIEDRVLRGGTVVSYQPPATDVLWQVVQRFQTVQQTAHVDLGWWKCREDSCHALGTLFAVATKDQMPPLRLLDLIQETTLYQLRVSMPGDGTQFSTLVELHCEVAISVFSEVLKTGDTFHFDLPTLSSNTINPSMVEWFRTAEVTSQNYDLIARALASIVANVARTLPSERTSRGRALWEQLRFYNLFSDTIENQSLGQQLTFALLTQKDLIDDPQESTLGDYGETELEWPRGRAFENLIDRIQNALVVVDVEHDQFLYKMLAALNEQFGLPGQRHITSVGARLHLSKLTLADSGTYIAVTHEKFKVPQLIRYPKTFYDEAWSLLAVINISVVEDRAPLVVEANYKGLPVAFALPSIPETVEGLEYTPFDWKRLDEAQLWKGRVVTDRQAVPSTLPSAAGLYAYIDRPPKLSDADAPYALLKVPFELVELDETRPFDSVYPAYLRSVIAIQRLEVEPIRNFAIGIGKALVINAAEYVPANASDPRWAFVRFSSSVELPQRFELVIREVDADSVGMYDLSFQLASGEPGLLRFSVEAIGKCQRCMVTFSESSNRHGSCQWHTKHAPGQVSDESLVRGIFQGKIPLNPNIYMGQASDPDHKLGRRWMCCNKPAGHPGCWIGKHSAASAVPDLQDHNHNSPRRGTEYINDPNTNSTAYANIVNAYNTERFFDGIELERRFNSVHGGFLRPSFELFTSEATEAYVRLLADSVPWDERDLEEVFTFLDYDASFGLWKHNDALMLNYKSWAPLVRPLPTERYEKNALELFQLFAEFRKQMPTGFSREVFLVWRERARTIGLVRKGDRTDEEEELEVYRTEISKRIQQAAKTRETLLDQVERRRTAAQTHATKLRKATAGLDEILGRDAATELIEQYTPLLSRFNTITRNIARETKNDVQAWRGQAIRELFTAKSRGEIEAVYAKFIRGLGSGVRESEPVVNLKATFYWLNVRDAVEDLKLDLLDALDTLDGAIKQAKKDLAKRNKALAEYREAQQQKIVDTLTANVETARVILGMIMPKLPEPERTAAIDVMELAGLSMVDYQTYIADQEALLHVFRSDTLESAILSWLRRRVDDQLAKQLLVPDQDAFETIYTELSEEVANTLTQWQRIAASASTNIDYEGKKTLLVGFLAKRQRFFEKLPENLEQQKLIIEVFRNAQEYLDSNALYGFEDYKAFIAQLLTGTYKNATIPSSLGLASFAGSALLYQTEWKAMASYMAVLVESVLGQTNFEWIQKFFGVRNKRLLPLFELLGIEDTLVATLAQLYKPLPNPIATAQTNLAKLEQLDGIFANMYNYFRRATSPADVFARWMHTLASQADPEFLEDNDNWGVFLAIAMDASGYLTDLDENERPLFAMKMWEIWELYFTEPRAVAEKVDELEKLPPPAAGESQLNYIIRNYLRPIGRLRREKPVVADVFLYNMVGDDYLQLLATSDYSKPIDLVTNMQHLYRDGTSGPAVAAVLKDQDYALIQSWFTELKSLLFSDIDIMPKTNYRLTTYSEVKKKYGKAYPYFLYLAQTSTGSFLQASINKKVRSFRKELNQYNTVLVADTRQFDPGLVAAQELLTNWTAIVKELNDENRFLAIANSIRGRLPFILNRLYATKSFLPSTFDIEVKLAPEYSLVRKIAASLKTKWIYEIDLSKHLFNSSRKLETLVDRFQPDEEKSTIPNSRTTLADAYAIGSRLANDAYSIYVQLQPGTNEFRKRKSIWNALDPLDYLVRSMLVLVVKGSTPVRPGLELTEGAAFAELYNAIADKLNEEDRTRIQLLLRHTPTSGDPFLNRRSILAGNGKQALSDAEVVLAQIADSLDLPPYDSTTNLGERLWMAIADFIAQVDKKTVRANAVADGPAYMLEYLQSLEPDRTTGEFVTDVVYNALEQPTYPELVREQYDVGEMIPLEISKKSVNEDDLLFYFDLFASRQEFKAAGVKRRVLYALELLGVDYIPILIGTDFWQISRVRQEEKDADLSNYLDIDASKLQYVNYKWIVLDQEDKSEPSTSSFLAEFLAERANDVPITMYFEDTFGFALMRATYLTNRNRSLARLATWPELEFDKRLEAARRKYQETEKNLYSSALKAVDSILAVEQNRSVDTWVEEEFLDKFETELGELYFEDASDINFYDLFRTNIKRAVLERLALEYPVEETALLRKGIVEVLEATEVPNEADVVGITRASIGTLALLYATLQNRDSRKRIATTLANIYSAVSAEAETTLRSLLQLNDHYREASAMVLDEREQSRVIASLSNAMAAVQKAGFVPLSESELAAIFDVMRVGSTSFDIFYLEQYYEKSVAEKLYETFDLLVVRQTGAQKTYQAGILKLLEQYTSAQNAEDFFVDRTVDPPARSDDVLGLAEEEYYKAAVHLSYWNSLRTLANVVQPIQKKYKNFVAEQTNQALVQRDRIVELLQNFYRVSNDLSAPAAVVYWTSFLRNTGVAFSPADFYNELDALLSESLSRHAKVLTLPVPYQENPTVALDDGREVLQLHTTWSNALPPGEWQAFVTAGKLLPALQSFQHYDTLLNRMEANMLKPLASSEQTQFDPLYEVKLTKITTSWIQAAPKPGKNFGGEKSAPFLELLLAELYRLPTRNIEFRTSFGLVAGSFINVSDVKRNGDFVQSTEYPGAYPVLPTQLFQDEEAVSALSKWSRQKNITILSTRFRRLLPKITSSCTTEADEDLYDGIEIDEELLPEDAFLSTLFKVPVAELSKEELQRELAYLQRLDPQNLSGMSEAALRVSINALYISRRDAEESIFMTRNLTPATVTGDSEQSKKNREFLRSQLSYYNERADAAYRMSLGTQGRVLLQKFQTLYTEPLLLERSSNRAYLQKLLVEEVRRISATENKKLRNEDYTYAYIAVDTIEGKIVGHALWYHLLREESINAELLFEGDVVTPDQYATRSMQLEYLCGSEDVQAALILRGLIDAKTMSGTKLVEVVPKRTPWLQPVRRTFSDTYETEVLIVYYPLDFDQSNLLLSIGFEPLFASDYLGFLPDELRVDPVSSQDEWYAQSAKQFVIPDSAQDIALDEPPAHTRGDLEFQSITAAQQQVFVSPLLDRFNYEDLIDLLTPIEVALPFDVHSLLNSLHNRVATLRT